MVRGLLALSAHCVNALLKISRSGRSRAGAGAGERGLPSGKKIHDNNDEECEDDLHCNVNGSTVVKLTGSTVVEL
jgi:hypothetical protein